MAKTKDLELMLSDTKTAILTMSGPLFVAYLVTQLQLFVDSFWCSGLGPDAMSGITLSAPIYWLIIDVGIGIGVGASTAIARSLGANDEKRANSLASQSLMLSVLLSIASSALFLIFLEPLLILMGGKDVIGYSMDYSLPIVIMSFPFILSGILTGLLRAEGAAKKSMALSMVAAVLNIILCPVMIYGLGLGVMGASLATVISYSIMVVIGLYWYLQKKMYVQPVFKGFRFDWEQIKDIFTVGIPHALELAAVSLLIIPQNVLVVACGGSEGVVTYYYPYRYVMIAMMPAKALASAMIPVTSATQGQRDFQKTKHGFRYTAKVAILLGFALGLLVFIFSDPLTKLFCLSPDTAHLHGEMTLALMIYAACIPTGSCVFVCSAIMQSLRLAQRSTLVMIFRETLLIVLFYYASKISMYAIYWSLTIGLIIGAGIMIWLTISSIKTSEKKFNSETTV